jgi:transposase
MARYTTSIEKVCFAGVDYHKKFSVATVGDQNGNIVKLGVRLANDKESIRRFFADYAGIQVAVESCRGYEWFVDYLKELGLIVHLANPLQTKLISQSRAKTDKVDSKTLMQLLAIGFLPTCYQPTPEERRLRERLRWRASAVRSTTTMKIRIHALLDKENLGLGIERVFSTKGRQFLSQVPLTETRRQLLNQHLLALEFHESLVSSEDAWVKQAVKESHGAQLLMTIPGIGELTALVLVAELGDITRFKTSGQVASYVGLTPKVKASADHYRLGGISKQGSSMVRWMLCQAAWMAIRCSYEFLGHYNSVLKRCGKQAAITSVSRKLVQVAFRVLRDQQSYKCELVGKKPA